MITLYDSGTVTANGVATATLSQPAVPGKFTLKLDLVNLAAGDYASVLISAKALAGGALRALWGSPIYAGAQTYDLVIMPEIPNDLTESTALQFDLSYSTGGSRSIPWALMKDDALVPTTAGNKLDVTSGGTAGLDWNNVESPTTTLNLSGTTLAGVTSVSSPVGVASNYDKGNYVLATYGSNAVAEAVWATPVLTEPAAVFAWASAVPRAILTWLGAMSSNKLEETATRQYLNTRAGVQIATSVVSDDSTTGTRGSFT